MHVERLGTDDVDGILKGHCVISTKIDGTSGVIWLDDRKLLTGSRKRQLSFENDNHGFTAYVHAHSEFQKYLEQHPTHILYGEFLVK